VGEVRPGEGAKAAVLGTSLFLLLASYYLLKVVRESLILSSYDAEVKVYVSAGQAVLLIPAVMAFGWLSSRMGRFRLVVSATLFFAANLVIFAVLYAIEVPIALPFYVWVGIFNVFVISQLWAFATDVYSETDGKRLFAVIGLGASLGAIVGAYAAEPVGDAIGTFGIFGLALALLLSTIGKSALFPASGWLPRAMEGPTPSSALFYGALSVHAGIYLLLRSAPLFESTPFGSVAVIVIGVLTVITSSLAGRVQSDIKGALAYATSSQVGLMALGVGVAALTHSGWLAMLVVAYMVAHAFLRTLQLLRAPSALRDAQEIAAALPDARRSAHASSHFVPERTRALLHRLAHHRFFLDDILDRWLVGPVLAIARAADGLERRWVETLAGLPANERTRAAPRESAQTPDTTRTATPTLVRDAREKVEPA